MGLIWAFALGVASKWVAITETISPGKWSRIPGQILGAFVAYDHFWDQWHAQACFNAPISATAVVLLSHEKDIEHLAIPLSQYTRDREEGNRK